MMRVLTLSASITLSLMLVACDNTAKVPQAKTDSTTTAATSTPLVIPYNEFPSSMVWQLALEKGWIKESGVNVKFEYFADYASSIDAFLARKLDANIVTNGDNFMLSSGGTKGVIILAVDYSNGTDVILAKPDIHSLQDLKGKTVAFEKGLVSDLLFNTALADHHLDPKDFKVLNASTSQLSQVFTSPDVSAVVLWQPMANQALKAVPGSKVIYSSKDKPGLIYDTLSVNAQSLETRREDWKKLIIAWDKAVNYLNDPKTRDDAINIMAKKAGISTTEFSEMIDGVHILSLQENKKVMQKNKELSSLYGSSYNVNEFNLKNGIYSKSVNVDGAIYPDIVNELP
ncbi:ABC transporter substrate-binding protein [Acinetobacter qingfengensis]|uniref:ABC transporter substrate-binding protein n=1 Tax=Acinetobacter qingfengensis TaxID=1262585 RepID=A0A1E7R583_9GAMM|nr:ABC transporter substrate-binding protein [Acinetobacter qingfengensis]KAA8732429.1 ABC transporter substrate-binding protein [Acinetobacter qingfengensis]OEY94423.1 ABC transporter substrate-binding protein [Acinetobacter qingfengensis]